MYYKRKAEADLMRQYHKVLFYTVQHGFAVQPFCDHIFEPQEGDKNIDGYVFDSRIKLWRKIVMTHVGECVYNIKELPINERNGKVFIMPERE